MPFDPNKFHELAMKYDPLPVLNAIEQAAKHMPPAAKVPPQAMQPVQQGLMQVPGQVQQAAPVAKSPWE